MYKILILALLLCFTQAFPQSGDDNNRFMLAQNFEQAGEYARAKQLYQELYNRNPGFYLYFESLNRMFVQLKEYSNSESLIGRALVSKPDDINLVILLGRTYHIEGNEKKTDSLWRSFLTSKPQTAQVYRIFANSSLELRNFDKAIGYLKEARERTSEKVQLTYEISNLLSLKMQYSEAVTELLTIIDLDPGAVRSVESRLMGVSQKPGATEETIKALEARSSENNPYYNFLLAAMYKEAGNYSKALSLLKKIDLPIMNNGGEIYNLAGAAADGDDFASAADGFSFILSRFPKSPFVPQAKLGLAKNISRAAYLRGADSSTAWKPLIPAKKYPPVLFNDAIDAYREIFKTFPHTDAAIEAHYNLAKIYFDTGNSGEAENFVNAIITNYPMSQYFGKAVLLSAEKKIASGNLKEGSALIERILTSPGSGGGYKTEAKFIKAKIAFYGTDFSSASDIINGIYTELRDNKVNDALEFSLLTNVNLSDSAALAEFAGAEFLLLQGKTADAYSIFDRLSKNDNLYLLNFYSSLRKMEIDIAESRYASAIQISATVSGEKLNIFADKASYYSCLTLLYGLKDPAGAASAMEAFLEKFSSSLYADKIRALLVNLKNKNI